MNIHTDSFTTSHRELTYFRGRAKDADRMILAPPVLFRRRCFSDRDADNKDAISKDLPFVMPGNRPAASSSLLSSAPSFPLS